MGGVKFPTLGSQVAHQIGDHQFELPNFVRIGGRGQDAGNAGFLGVDFDPLHLNDPSKPPENTVPTTSESRFRNRLELLQAIDADFGRIEGTEIVRNQRRLVAKASQMILSPQMRTFDLEQEPQAVRDRYGDTKVGAGCLLARRLVESGVTFVEVNHDGWDTHQDNFTRTAELGGQIDQAMSALIGDLDDRGMLENTLVVWMGEFGRTPKINPRGGRDHYPKAFNVALAGGRSSRGTGDRGD